MGACRCGEKRIGVGKRGKRGCSCAVAAWHPLSLSVRSGCTLAARAVSACASCACASAIASAHVTRDVRVR
eukprot:5531832-Pleurochrysis_carterae.AAC.1